MQLPSGRAAPIGATVVEGGVNFSLYSRDATGVELLLFDDDDDAPSRTVALDASLNRTYHYWHVFVPGMKAGQRYAYRVHGPFDPSRGLRFDPSRVLLDAYSRGVAVPNAYQRHSPEPAHAMKSVVVDSHAYNWGGDAPPRRPTSQTIVYEMHIKGFTRHPSSGVAEDSAGTYRGLVDKIGYLQDLGITAVELLPVFQFDAQECPPGLVNYWGYAPISFFAPHQAYSSRKDGGGPTDEFRDMVKALHAAGIEVILDVVFNHTSEVDETGPTTCFRGIDNRTYYMLEDGGARYANYSGCGNTLNTNHPVVSRLILDSLRYWVREMHVDGFRFDLASVLSRAPDGRVLTNAPLLWDIESDPLLANTKLIAEAWDATGLYQVGTFVGDSWQEWNGRFRDDVRSFWRGDNAAVRQLADRLVGSHEMYRHSEREPEQSVNFITCHDGFTLNDVVSYDVKHNEANGTDNRDGSDDNRSWNCGAEGPTDNPDVERLRNRQVKNLLTVTLLAMGMPMLLMGDEVRRTQCGNNNDYCHDDVGNWFDWGLVESHSDVHRFVKMLLACRLLSDVRERPLTLSEQIDQRVTGWHGTRLHQPDWNDDSHSLAVGVQLPDRGVRLHVIFNAYWEPLEFQLPPVGNGAHWRRWLDTACDSPEDVVAWECSPPVRASSYRAEARSSVVLWTPMSRD